MYLGIKLFLIMYEDFTYNILILLDELSSTCIYQLSKSGLPRALIQRLDRYLDWWNLHRQAKFSRNAAIRQALNSWLDDQEQCAGFLEPQFQRQQFQNAYHSLSKRHEWVAIHHLRQLMPWSRERFDAMIETLLADHHV